MKKIFIAICLLLLFGCSKNKTTYCERNDGNRMTTIIIDSEYDEIKTILIEESFALKPSLLADQNKLEDFLLSIDDDHELRDGRIVLRKRIEGGQSLSLSVDELSKNYFYCSLDALR